MCFIQMKCPNRTMSDPSLENYFSPPKAVRGSKTLDRAAFQRHIQLPAIRLQRANLCSSFLKYLAHVCLKFPPINKVLDEIPTTGEVWG